MAYELGGILSLGGDFIAKMQKAADSAEKLEKQVNQTSKQVNALSKIESVGKKMSAGLSQAKDAFGALGLVSAGFLKGTIDEAADAQKLEADLNQTIKSTGMAAGLTAGQVSAMAESFSKTTTFEDDAIKQGQNMLLTFTNIGKNVFPMATEAMLNMAQKMGTEPVASSIQLGKALNDPTKGLTALTRVGVTFTEQQKKQIETMQKAGNMAGAQKIILNELNREFGGQAQAAAQTYEGRMKQLSNAMKDIKESIGTAVLPYVQKAAEAFLKIAHSIQDIPKPVMDVIAKVIGLVAVFGTLVGGTSVLKRAFTTLFPSIGGLGGMISKLSGPIGIIIIALTALTYAYTKNIGGFKTFVDKIFQDVISIFNAFKAAISGGDVGKALSSSFGKNTAKIKVVIQGIVDAVKVFGAILSGNFKAASSVLDNWGNGSDASMQKVVKTVAKVALTIREVISNIVNFVKAHMPEIKATIQTVFQGISTVWNSVLKPILKILLSTIGIVISFVKQHWPEIQKVIETVFKGIMAVWNSVLKPALKFIISTLQQVVKWVTANFPLIKNTIATVLNAVWSVIKIVLGAIKSFWNTWGQTIMDVVKTTFNNIKIVITTVIKVIEGIIKMVMQIINGDWKGAWKSLVQIVKDIFGGVGKLIKNTLSGVGNIFKDIAKVAIGWGKDMIQGLINGITSKVSGIVDAVKGIGNKIKSFLHFSVPDEGPLKDYMTWTPDFMKGMAGGIKANVRFVTDATKNVATGIKENILPKASEVKSTTIINTNSSSSKNDKTYTIMIPKLADQLIVREDADIDKIADAFVKKLKGTSFNMA